jgi:hypothetical protein
MTQYMVYDWRQQFFDKAESRSDLVAMFGTTSDYQVESIDGKLTGTILIRHPLAPSRPYRAVPKVT